LFHVRAHTWALIADIEILHPLLSCLDIQKQEFHYNSNGRKALDMQILIDFASSSFGKKGFLEPIWRVASDMQS